MKKTDEKFLKTVLGITKSDIKLLQGDTVITKCEKILLDFQPNFFFFFFFVVFSFISFRSLCQMRYSLETVMTH